MRSLPSRFLFIFVLLATSFFGLRVAYSFPLYQVKKGGLTSWIVGTTHSVKVRNLPEAISCLLPKASVVLTEMGARPQEKALRKALAGLPPHPRSLQDVLGPELWPQFRDTMAISGVDVPSLDFQPGFQLVRTIDLAFVQTEEVEVFNRLAELSKKDPVAYANVESVFHSTLKNMGLAAKTDRLQPNQTEPNLDVLVPYEANLLQVPVVALDTPDTLVPLVKSGFSDAELKRFVAEHLVRLNQVRTSSTEELTSLAIQFARDQWFNVENRYWDWTPGALSFDPVLPETSVIRVPETPAFLKREVWRHTAWMPEIMAALEKGGALIVVGDAHVTPGRISGMPTILTLLEKQGFTVEFGASCLR